MEKKYYLFKLMFNDSLVSNGPIKQCRTFVQYITPDEIRSVCLGYIEYYKSLPGVIEPTVECFAVKELSFIMECGE